MHWQVGRLLALENAIDIAGSTPELIDYISPIGDQAAAGDKEAFEVDRGQFVPGRKPDDQIAMNLRQRAPCHDYAAIRGVRECSDGALDLAGIAHDAVVSPFSQPAPSVGEADDFKIERQLIFVRSAERIGIDRSSAAREQRLLVSDATLTREGCKRIRQAVRQER